MPLIKLIFFTLLCGILTLAHAEEQLALSTSLTAPETSDAPMTLVSARNIKMELIADNVENDLWQRIRGGFAMRDLDSELIAKHEQWYASRPDYVARMTDRARRYLYFIAGEVERRGMPSEIALLPMIESAFNPGAYSTGKASGIWQFIPSTGKNFGMKQDWWYDGRRDVVTATNGALDYLQKLHDMFGDWELALAAYNWGEGAVQRAQERNRRIGLPINYTSLKMPDETRNYVPKLLAIKNIIAQPASYGLVLQNISNQPYFAAVSTAKHIDVKLAAQLADISLEEFRALNPAHNRPVILQSNSDMILLPVDNVETFRANLENYDKPLVSWQTYQAKQHESLDHLAPRFGLSVEKLKSVNSLVGQNSVSTGQTLLVPIGETVAEPEDFAVANMHLRPTPERSALRIHHKVKRGDTLASIARKYHVTPAKIKSWNERLTKPKVGESIIIVQNVSNSQVKVAKLSLAQRRLLLRKAKHPVVAAGKAPHKITKKTSRSARLAYNTKH